ncbi:MAG: GNAT family N-acetyltransferase [Candidatus Latescibacteria bacterium]|nr:GNAT family N-acetyltransferase [Candidatus Latescibacterota bacterium]
MARKRLEVHPLTPSRWRDLARLFGERGACGGCWCMWWRLTGGGFSRGKGAGNRAAFRRIVGKGPPPGLLAYVDGAPVGWCALAPRADYPRLEHSRVLKPIDDRPVWSVTCFFVARPHRGAGVTVRLLRAAADHARKHGARILEGYPTDTHGRRSADVWVYTGLLPAFEKAGFREAARRSRSRPIMRRRLSGRS